jgi:hypothetical protein
MRAQNRCGRRIKANRQELQKGKEDGRPVWRYSPGRRRGRRSPALGSAGPEGKLDVGGLRCRLEHASRNQRSYHRDSAEHKGVDKPLGHNHHASPGSNYSLTQSRSSSLNE